MLNPIFWKKVQGHKHPGRWGIVENQIPSIKVLFKTNAKSHKYPGVKLLSTESKTQLVNKVDPHIEAYQRQIIIDYKYWQWICMRLWSTMPDCRYEELITIFSAQYSGDHIWRLNATDSPTRVHSSRPMSRPVGGHTDRTYMHEIS